MLLILMNTTEYESCELNGWKKRNCHENKADI